MKRYILILCVFAASLSIAVKANSKADISITPSHADWVFQVGEEAIVSVEVVDSGIPIEAEISIEVGQEKYPFSDKKTRVVTQNGIAKVNLGTRTEPGFLHARLSIRAKQKDYKREVKVGFSPEKIVPCVTMPEDFDSFWSKTKDELEKLPIDPIYTHLPEYSTEQVDVFLVSIQNFRKGNRLYGFLCKPKKEGKYPVLFTPPGAGIKRVSHSIEYAEAGFISFSIEIHGISPLLDSKDYGDVARAFGSYMTFGIDNKDNYYYKKVYMGCVRSIDFLCSLPEFDGKNVVVTGGSQGGALSIVTAALDSRVTALVSFYPALCDIEGFLHGRAGGWPSLFRDADINDPVVKNQVNTLRYYDVVNFARKVKVPGFYSWGFNDNTCPPTSVYAAINSISALKEVVITPLSAHWRYPETDKESVKWLRRQCGME